MDLEVVRRRLSTTGKIILRPAHPFPVEKDILLQTIRLYGARPVVSLRASSLHLDGLHFPWCLDGMYYRALQAQVSVDASSPATTRTLRAQT